MGAKEKFDPAKDPLVVRPSQVLEMRYQAENRSNGRETVKGRKNVENFCITRPTLGE